MGYLEKYSDVMEVLGADKIRWELTVCNGDVIRLFGKWCGNDTSRNITKIYYIPIWYRFVLTVWVMTTYTCPANNWKHADKRLYWGLVHFSCKPVSTGSKHHLGPHYDRALGIMLNKGNHEQMALIQVSGLIWFTQILWCQDDSASAPSTHISMMRFR